MAYSHIPRSLGLLLVVAYAGMLTGCSEYLARQDKISFSAGDAKAHNTAVHMVDPWARRTFNQNMRTPGTQAEAAMVKYRKGGDSTTSAPSYAPVLITGASSQNK